ncbi:MAG: M36 family metallopeptidase [Pyrinomonadaceae bacterium]
MGKTGSPASSAALGNFDIRDSQLSQKSSEPTAKGGDAKSSELTLESLKPRTTPPAQSALSLGLQQSMREAEEHLAARLPSLQVERNEVVHVPEIVAVAGGGALHAANPGESNENVMRSFLSENAALYGMTAQQTAQLTKVSDYTNPAGNLSFVEFQQEVNGIPVFQGYVRGVLSADGRLVRTTGLLAPVSRPGDFPTSPAQGATEAVASGAASVRVAVDPGSLAVTDQSSDGRTAVVSQGPFTEETKTELVYFPLAPGNLVLAYSMVLWEPNVAYYVVVDANTGELLWRKNITQDQTQPVTYNVYNDDSPTPSSPTTCAAPTPCPLPPGITRSNITEVSENAAADNLGWISDGVGPTPTPAVTTGNNVDAGIDRVAPNGIDPTGRATATSRVFSFPYIPDGAADPTGSNNPLDTNYQMGAVTNIFFWTNRYHDLIYNYGFTEAARNFQNDNFGRGGLGADFVRAEAQDSSSTNNANFSTPADGQLPRMQMFIFTTTPQRDGDLDADVFYHEMTHGTSNRLHANATGLGSNESQGMGEGWSDYYARALRSDASENVDGIYAAGGYVTKNYYYGIRRFPYAVKSNVGPNSKPHNPETFADTDPALINLTDGAFPPAFNGAANEVHDIGEVWCTALLEMRAQLIHSLGYATGNPRAIQIVTDGMKLDPSNPTMIDSRNSIIAANCAGFAGANELDVWKGFTLRGMGFRAGYKLSIDGVHVNESFEDPNLTLGSVTATETTGDGDGVFEPGETVTLSIPLQNTLCATTATNTTATLSPGGGSANYGNVSPGALATQTITFTIPTNTYCGASIPININVNSTTLGPITYTYNLPVGQPNALTPYENFDGVTAPALPAGWTTSHTGASLGWVTTTNNPDTAPNAASTTDPANAGTGSLTSPAIPVDTAQAQISFRNLYNLESGFDTMILVIQIDNGSYQELTAAGGSFVSGGYNSQIGWTGLSAGTTAAPTYITTVANLPPAASGHIIHLRWTVIGDANTTAPGAAGAKIDTISLSTTAQACTSFGVSTVNISGRVTDPADNGINGIQVTLSGSTTATATTAGSGNYSFNGLASGGNYTVTPTTPGNEYTPPSRTFNGLAANVTNADFISIPAAGISGRVTTPNGAAGLDGITVTLSGSQAGAMTTSGGGFYSFSPLPRHGNYTVTPSGGNNTFTPPSRTYNDLNAAVTDANFAATEILTCDAIGSPITGSIAAGDTTQTNRVARDGNPSGCGGSKAFPGETAVATIRYDQYTFTNTSGSPACIKVSIAANFSVHSEAYLNSYDPANKGTNFLGDLGIAYAGNNTTASYSFTVPAGATYVIVVNETAAGVGGNYTLSLCNSAGTQPPAPLAQKGQVLITEFRQSVGSTTSSNEYVELYNNTDAPIGIGGYGLAVFNATFGGDVVLGFPSPLTIPRRGHLIIANVAAGGYSLSGYASPDLSHANANLMPDNQGFGLIDNTRSVLIDSVGFTNNSGNLPYIEGQGLQPTIGNRPNVEHAWVRRINDTTTFPQDTDNNAADFQLVSVTGATFNASPPIPSILGAPGPQNLSSPADRSSFVHASLVDPAFSNSTGENRKRLQCNDPNAPPCPADPNTSAFGYLSIRRKFTNTSGASVTRLRFTVADITTLNTPGGGPATGQADVRVLSSNAITVTVNGSPVQVQGTTLEQPPTQTLGGGLNSSLNAGTITLGTPLANGQSINVQFLLGVQKSGSFRFFVAVEALP